MNVFAESAVTGLVAAGLDESGSVSGRLSIGKLTEDHHHLASTGEIAAPLFAVVFLDGAEEFVVTVTLRKSGEKVFVSIHRRKNPNKL